MAMTNYPHDVWILHRKIHHRYLRFRKCFEEACEELEEYKESMETATAGKTKTPDVKIPSTLTVSLMSDSGSATDFGSESNDENVEEDNVDDNVDEDDETVDEDDEDVDEDDKEDVEDDDQDGEDVEDDKEDDDEDVEDEEQDKD